MEQRTYEQLGDTSSERLEEVFRQRSEIKALEADAVIRQRLEEMKGDGSVLMLSEDEERMLRAYRFFRLRSKYGDVFKWRCHGKDAAISGAAIEAHRETGLVIDPREA
jgi:hypothetical protein